MAFLETPVFPINISFGSSGGPRFRTDIVEFGNGREYRNSRWEKPLMRFDVRYAMRSRADIQNVYEFFLARKGRFEGFRVKDQFDFTSNDDGVTAPVFTDQIIGVADGITTEFQIIKNYNKGGETSSRDIVKPEVGTISSGVGGVLKTIGVDYNLDTTTGKITYLSAPVSGNITAGYQFHVPCRFDTDDLSDLEFVFKSNTHSIDILSLPSIPLIEIRI